MPELGRLPQTKSARESLKEPSTHPNRLETDRGRTSGQQDGGQREHVTVPSSTDEKSFPALPKPKASILGNFPPIEPKTLIARPDTKGPVKQSKMDKPEPKTTIREQDPKAERRKSESLHEEDLRDQPTERTDKPSASENTEATFSRRSAIKGAGEQPFKRQHPGKLDISAAREIGNIQDAVNQTPATNATQSPLKTAADGPITTGSGNSRPETPGISSEATSRKSAQPRTLRVLATPTPKSETAPQTAPPSASSAPAPAPRITPKPSRQASITSVTIPDTPASDRGAYETQSVTTESHSRTSSPPPATKVGSAPVRVKTKSQQKKERKDRGLAEKPDAEQESVTPPDVVQEPIIGRKKKAKKPTVLPPLKQSYSVPSKEKKAEKEEVEKTHSEQNNSVHSAELSQETAKPDKEIKADDEKKQSPFVNSMIELLLASGDISQETLSSLVKASPSFVPKSAYEPDLRSPRSIAPLTRQEISQLTAGQPVRRSSKQAKSKSGKNTEIADRVLITPHTRLCIRGLAKELEDHLVELDSRIAKSRPPRKYSHRSSSSAAASAAKVVDEMLKEMMDEFTQIESNAATPVSPNQSTSSTGQQLPNTDQQSDGNPVYADDALNYLNQFILPYTLNGSAGSMASNSVGRQSVAPDTSAHLAPDPAHGSERPEPRRSFDTHDFLRLSPHPAPSSAGLVETSDPAPPKPSPSIPGSNFPSLPSLAASYSANLDFLTAQLSRSGRASGSTSNEARSPSDARLSGNISESAAREWAHKALQTLDWKSADWARFNASIENDLKNLPHLASLPPEVMSLGAEAIRAAIMSTGGLGRSSSHPAASSTETARATEGRGQKSGEGKGRSKREEEVDEAAKLMGEIEAALVASKKELENVEKRLSGVVKRNRKAVGV